MNAKSVTYNAKVISVYWYDWLIRILKIIFLIGLYLLVFYIVHQISCQIFSHLLFLNLFFFMIPTSISIIILFTPKHDYHFYKSDYEYKSIFRIIFEAIGLVLSFLPITLIIYYFGYDWASDTQKFSLGQILLWTPIVLIVMILGGLFFCNNSQHIISGLPNIGDSSQKMTRAELFLLRRDLDMIGIDYNKVIFSPYDRSILSMTRSEWFLLARDLELVGYNIRK